jgi:hypothetical protein
MRESASIDILFATGAQREPIQLDVNTESLVRDRQ